MHTQLHAYTHVRTYRISKHTLHTHTQDAQHTRIAGTCSHTQTHTNTLREKQLTRRLSRRGEDQLTHVVSLNAALPSEKSEEGGLYVLGTDKATYQLRAATLPKIVRARTQSVYVCLTVDVCERRISMYVCGLCVTRCVWFLVCVCLYLCAFGCVVCGRILHLLDPACCLIAPALAR